jgi:hypothetical protein
MQYEERLSKFIEHYTLALVGSKDYSAALQFDPEDNLLELFIHKPDNKCETIISFELEKVIEIDETAGVENRITYVSDMPFKHIKQHHPIISSKVLPFFGRLCNITVANMAISHSPFVVAGEIQSSVACAMPLQHWSNDFVKFFIVPRFPDTHAYCDIYLPDGSMFDRFSLELKDESYQF